MARLPRSIFTASGFVSLAAAVLVAAGCGGAGPPPAAWDQVLRINTFSQPPTFDPAQSPGLYSQDALIRVFSEPLLQRRPDADEVTAAAAESFDVAPDGLTYTFHLSPAGRFNDGEPVRARDFVHAWRRLIDPRTAAPFRRQFARSVRGGPHVLALRGDADDRVIEATLNGLGLRAVDDTTFEVTLDHPMAYFPWIATLPAGAPVPAGIEARFGRQWATRAETLITNGPFKVASVERGASVTLVPNPFFRAPPRLDRIVAYQLGRDANGAWAKYLNDGLDITNGPPSAAIPATLHDRHLGAEASTRLEPSIVFIELNTRKPPFDNPKVRLAVARAIDRNSFAHLGVGLVTLKPITALVPEGLPGHTREGGAVQGFDPAGAKAALAASGARPSQLDGVHLLATPGNSLAAALVKDQLEHNLGMRVTIDAASDAGPRGSRGDFQMSIEGYYGASYPDPAQLFDLFLSGSPGNHSRWSDSRYDRLVGEADTSVDANRRLELYAQAERILAEEAPVVFMGQVVRYFWIKPWVKGIRITPYDDADFPGDLSSATISIAPH